MANFPGLILTASGRDILSKALAGDTLTFTRLALGDGVEPGAPEDLTALVNEQQSVSIQSLDAIGDGTAKLRAVLTNIGVEVGYFAREIGIYATDPDTLDELLYAYANAGVQADYVPAYGGATTVEHVFDLFTVVDTAAEVVALIDGSIVYATKDDVVGTAIQGLKVVPPGSSNDYLITNFSSFSSYSVASDVGAVSIADDTITLTIDAGEPQGGINMTVTRDGIPKTFQLAVGAESVAQPTIVAPADGQTEIGSGVTLVTSEFATYPSGADTHASTDWQVSTDAAFSAVVFESLADAINLESIVVPSGTLETSTTYYARARHSGATLGASAYSPTISFVTADAFAPANEVAKLLSATGTANDGFGTGVGVSGDYAIIGEPGAPGGRAHIYERNASGVWSLASTLASTTPATDRSFGENVAIDGDFAIIGDRLDSEVDDSSGAVFFAERTGPGWTVVAKFAPAGIGYRTWFGFSVAISGDYAVATSSEDGASGVAAGAFFFERVSGVWTQIAQVRASQKFASCAISGNFAALGEAGGNDVYIYERVSGVWTEVAILPDLGGQFGFRCDLDAGRLVVSDYSTGAGLAYVYEHDGAGNWPNVATLSPSDGITGDWFGYSVAISGDRILIGAPRDDNEGTDSGSAYLFERDAGGAWIELGRIWASDGAAGDYFGEAVAVSGLYYLVGAPDDDDLGTKSGSAYFYE